MKVIGLAGWSAPQDHLADAGVPLLLKKGLARFRHQARPSCLRCRRARQGFLRHRESGATEVLVSRPRRWALMHELRGAGEPRLPELLAKMRGSTRRHRGFQARAALQIEVHRAATASRCCSPTIRGGRHRDRHGG